MHTNSISKLFKKALNKRFRKVLPITEVQAGATKREIKHRSIIHVEGSLVQQRILKYKQTM